MNDIIQKDLDFVHLKQDEKKKEEINFQKKYEIVMK
jgi:hypothetical protein